MELKCNLYVMYYLNDNKVTSIRIKSPGFEDTNITCSSFINKYKEITIDTLNQCFNDNRI